MSKSKSVPVDKIPEVKAFEEANKKLAQFASENAELMDELDALVEDRNAALERAEMAVRAKSIEDGVGISCGSFRFKHFTDRVDGEKMFDALGEDRFAALGGAIKHIPSYIPDKAMALKAIATGEVTGDEAEMFYKKTPVYSRVKKVVMP